MYYKVRCLEGCRECLSICRHRAINKIRDKITIDQGKCIKCFECISVCPSQALILIGKRLSVEEVISEVEKDKVFYQSSDGGITLSGGEPLFQPKFTKEILKICKKKSIHTVLDTSGYGKWKDFERILKNVDLILYDIKHMDPKKHKELTGVDNKIILENIKKVNGLNIPILIRFLLIPEINDSKENFYKLAYLIKA